MYSLKYVSMDFVRCYFGTNEFLTSWTLFSSLCADLEKKWGQKCSTGQRFICTQVTSYKIHILTLLSDNDRSCIFTIGRSRTIGCGKIRPSANYRPRSRLFIFSPKISNLYLICRFIHLQNLKISWKLEFMKLKWNLRMFFQEKISFLTLDFSFF